MRTQRLFVLLAALPLAVGCYHYVPTTSLSHPQGTPLRANLSRMSSFELSQITVNNIDRVEGEMVRIDGSELVLSATWLAAVTGNGYPGNGWTVRIPEADVNGVELKKFSWWRTGVVVGGLVAATFLGFEALGVGPFGGSAPGGGGVQQ